jgi:deoxyribodipyrimidine photo-lyase
VQGGETHALKRLRYYLWETDLLKDYAHTRNGMLGGDYSTKFSPWLAHGCISPRTIYHEIQQYQDKRVSNKSTYWVVFELEWRDFFRFFAVKHENKIFFESGTCGEQLKWNSDMEVTCQLVRRPPCRWERSLALHCAQVHYPVVDPWA